MRAPDLAYRSAILVAALAVGGCSNKAKTSVTDAGGGDDAGTFAVADHRSMPPITNGKGKMLKPLRVVSIVSDMDDLGPKLLAFGDAMMQPKGPWLSAWTTEYGVDASGGHVKITGPTITGNQNDSDLQSYVNDALANAAPPVMLDGNTLILLYLPMGSAFVWSGAPNDCSMSGLAGVTTPQRVWGGYHKPFGMMGDQWAPIMRCPPLKGQSQLDELTVVASGLVANAATNPDGMGWALTTPMMSQPQQTSVWASMNGPCGSDCPAVNTVTEIADLCSVDSRFSDGTNAYHRIYSSKLGTAISIGDPCVPALSAPYYSTSTQNDWYSGQGGSVISIDVTGWSTAHVDDWPVRPIVGVYSDPFNVLLARITSDTNVTINGQTYQTINNNRTAKLSVTLPSAPSGWWGIVILRSFRLDAMGNPMPGEDYAHRTVIGVSVQ
jgi:hypothetical protein